MVEYFELYNLTKDVAVHPHTHGYGCKWGEFNPYEMMKQLNWSMDDRVVATGDHGTVHNLTASADSINEECYDDMLSEEGTNEERLTDLSNEMEILSERISGRGYDTSRYGTLDEMISKWK